ncbi:tetratricopeptide repeat protein [Blautia sp. RD014234]|nr:tetratricopeptide repeat protein [Blautia parvula]
MQAEKNVKENSRETYAPVYRVEIYYQLAVIYGKLDNPVKSIRYYELLLEEKIPVNLEQEARLSIAAMYRQMQEYMEAEKCYERYLSDFPQDAEAYCAYALMEAAERENQKKAESLLSLMEKRGAKKDGFNSKKIKNKIKALETEETE